MQAKTKDTIIRHLKGIVAALEKNDDGRNVDTKEKYTDSVLVNFYDCPECAKEIVEIEVMPEFCMHCGVKVSFNN